MLAVWAEAVPLEASIETRRNMVASALNRLIFSVVRRNIVFFSLSFNRVVLFILVFLVQVLSHEKPSLLIVYLLEGGSTSVELPILATHFQRRESGSREVDCQEE